MTISTTNSQQQWLTTAAIVVVAAVAAEIKRTLLPKEKGATEESHKKYEVNKSRTNIIFGWVLVALLSGSVVQLFGGSNSSYNGAVLVVRPGCIQ